MDEQTWQKRRLEANNVLLEEFGKIDKEDPEAVRKYDALSKLYHELNSDIKIYFDREVEEEKLKTEERRIDAEIAAKAAAIEVERERVRVEVEKLEAEKERSRIESEKLDVERERMKSDAEVKAEAMKVERERTEAQAKAEKRKAWLDVVGKIVIGVATALGAVAQIMMFWRATKKEEDEALLTETNKTVVRNGLSGKFFDF